MARVKRTERAQSFADNRERLDKLAKVGDAMGWTKASDVFVPIYAVPTIFPQFDEAVRVGGLPLERVVLVHGPSNEGKTAFVLGLGLSFLQRGHYFNFIDAERTTPSTWIKKLYRDFMVHPGFRGFIPETYEETVDHVRNFCNGIAKGRDSGDLDADTTGLVVVDSIRKLTPKNLLKNLLEGEASKGGKGKKKPKGIDGYGGRAAQYKAALNAQWMDDLCVLVTKTKTTIVIISRESENPDADPFYGEDFKVQGGGALFYESGIAVRVLREEKPIRLGEKDGYRMVGERHRLVIRKTKVASKESKNPVAHFHTSNGVLVPEGYDRARDLIELGLDLDVLQISGSHFKWGRRGLGQGEHAAVKKLHADPELCDSLEREIREKFRLEETRSEL